LSRTVLFISLLAFGFLTLLALVLMAYANNRERPDPASMETPVPTETPIPTVVTVPSNQDKLVGVPEHMANIWWHWPSGSDASGHELNTFQELEMDFTIHNDVGDFSDDHGLYLMLCYGYIGDVGFYFGLQTDVNDPVAGGRGKGLIFSRWQTRDLANARIADAEEGWTESSGHEGNFIGVRRSYPWSAQEYRVRMAPDGTDAEGTWFGVWITDKASGTTTWIGSLKFPYSNSEAVIHSPVYTTLEIYGSPTIRPSDIPEWRVSFSKLTGDEVEPVRFESGYSMFTGEVLNSNIQYDAADKVIYLEAGGFTERTDPEQTTYFD